MVASRNHYTSNQSGAKGAVDMKSFSKMGGGNRNSVRGHTFLQLQAVISNLVSFREHGLDHQVCFCTYLNSVYVCVSVPVYWTLRLTLNQLAGTASSICERRFAAFGKLVFIGRRK